VDPHSNDALRALLADCALKRPDWELWRREGDGRLLIAHQHHDGRQPWIIVANEGDWARQSVVLSNQEYRWLYWEALGGKYNGDWWDRGEEAERVLERLSGQLHPFLSQRANENLCAVCCLSASDPRHLAPPKTRPSLSGAEAP
jgi:hypothetical protein